ncbi:MAG: NAD-dependent deacetylase [Burkholderiaceae bacterium]|nr:NAD-dependent deacetylase [Burkholderiaceae bacterium]
MSPQQPDFRRAAELIAGADAIIVSAGAGMGVDSGLPDFRGNDGFWRSYPALGSRGMSFAQVASPETFRSDPSLAWGFYGHRLRLYRQTIPHDGFAILRRWIAVKPVGGRVVTSNVDGQFQKAGFPSELVREIHGSIHLLQCLEPCGSHIWSADGIDPQIDVEACRLVGEVPRCPHCGAMARPNILMFGDGGWNSAHSQRQRTMEQRWLSEVAQAMANVVIVEIGAGTTIPSIRNFSHQMIQEYGATLIRINVREPQVPGSKHIGLAMGAMDGLQGIEAALGLTHDPSRSLDFRV